VHFLPELLAGALPPLVAFAVLSTALGWPLLSSIPFFIAVWYGAETALAATAGWHLSWRSPFAWMVRDALLPVLWTASWLGNGFVWHDNPMRIADRGSAA
jgi:ceramide glucosyltransferase